MEVLEGLSRDGPIRCIFLSEFHPVHGSRISCQVNISSFPNYYHLFIESHLVILQVPDGYISKEIFHAVNVYIIPKPKTLQRCILTVNALKYKIIGYPVRIDDQKYARNAYHFNLCFVCDDWAKSVQYENTVKKLAEYFTMLEDESEFLSQDEENYDRIKKILESTLMDLNEKRETKIVEGETTIFLKIVQTHDDPPEVDEHQVPHLMKEFRNLSLEFWDLTTQQILPFIDGVNHVARIAREAGVDLGLVKSCVQNLVYYKVVNLQPLIKYSNVYMCTRNLQNLIKDPGLFAECREYVMIREPAEKGNDENEPVNGKIKQPANVYHKPPSLQTIFQLYSSMSHGQTLKTLCERFNIKEQHHIDERKLVDFGLKHKLIRTINKYPVFIGSVPTDRQKLYNGYLSLDEICCRTGLSPASIENDINLDTNVTVLWK